MGDRDYYRKEFMQQRSIFKPGFDNAIVSLIIFHLVVYTLLLGIYLIYLVTYDTATIADPAYVSEVHGAMNVPADPAMFITRPWTAISFMFTHFSFWRLLSNMLWLWVFGFIFQQHVGYEKLIPAYLYSGLIAAVFFVTSFIFFDANLAPSLTGSAAGIVGLAVATTILVPGYRIFPMLGNGIPLWVLTAVFLILDLGSVSQSYNLLIAHTAAGLMGWFFAAMLQQGRDIGGWMSRFGAWVVDMFNPERKYRNNPGKNIFYKARKEPFVKKPNLTQQKLDEILDKINQRGFESLTDEEKEFLNKASDQL